MKPFTAWLAMDTMEPLDGDCVFASRESADRWCRAGHTPQPVLIVADTPENRKKLGMEEGS